MLYYIIDSHKEPNKTKSNLSLSSALFLQMVLSHLPAQWCLCFCLEFTWELQIQVINYMSQFMPSYRHHMKSTFTMIQSCLCLSNWAAFFLWIQTCLCSNNWPKVFLHWHGTWGKADLERLLRPLNEISTDPNKSSIMAEPGNTQVNTMRPR